MTLSAACAITGAAARGGRAATTAPQRYYKPAAAAKSSSFFRGATKSNRALRVRAVPSSTTFSPRFVTAVVRLYRATIIFSAQVMGHQWYDGEIRRFVRLDTADPPPPGGMLFVGSSIFREWREVRDFAGDFAPIPVVNRAFGGSDTIDQLEVEGWRFAPRVWFAISRARRRRQHRLCPSARVALVTRPFAFQNTVRFN
jgi:hypothetical protein